MGTQAISTLERPVVSASQAKRSPHVLIVDSDPVMTEYLRSLFGDRYAVSVASSSAELFQRLQDGLSPDLLLLDSFLSCSDGLETLAEVRALKPTLRAIMMTCSSDPKLIVRAMRLGARDVLHKPFTKSELEQSIRVTLGPASPAAETDSQTHEIWLNDSVSFVHCNQRMNEIRSQCSLVARVDLPVLVLGESGTGKEVIAQFIHKMSPRSEKTFLKVNCAAMPADLLESELFGYEQGAFTGAIKSKPGKFEICNNGTLLLDEIGEMPPALQAKLLQVLQDGSFSRLGGRTTIKVDVRVIAATNIDMKAAIAKKSFREDLYYRLNGFTLSLPPLRERKEEIPVLIDYFMRKIATKYGREPIGVSNDLLQACMMYSWPGNLRELESFVKRYLVLGDEAPMMHELMPQKQRPQFNGPTEPVSGGLKGLVRSMKDDAEAIAIARVLEGTRWNRKNAAKELQISYKALLYKIKQYNLQPSGQA